MANQPFQILAVCTMNICRSPAMQQQLTQHATRWQELGSGPISVLSAGTKAVAGAASCGHTLGHLGVTAWDGVATVVSSELLVDSNLVLTAAAGHVSSVIAINPKTRSRVFTLRQASRYANAITTGPILETAVAKARGAAIIPSYEDPYTLAESLPVDPSERLAWLVGELDAARGTIQPLATEADPEPDDIADPHVYGSELHPVAAELIAQSVAELSAAIERVLVVDLG